MTNYSKDEVEFPVHRQLDSISCGPTCLLMIAEYYGARYCRDYLGRLCAPDSHGTSIMAICNAAGYLGLQSLAVRTSFVRLKELPLPAIALRKGHFIVVRKIEGEQVQIADPARGLLTYTSKEFMKGWSESDKEFDSRGVLLLFEPTAKFCYLHRHSSSDSEDVIDDERTCSRCTGNKQEPGI